MADILVDSNVIGAHAAVRDMAVLTRDARRYRAYFPTLTLIAPGT